MGKESNTIIINKKAAITTLFIIILAALIGAGVYFVAQKGDGIHFGFSGSEKDARQQAALIRTTRTTSDDFKVSAQGEIPEGYNIQLKSMQEDEKTLKKAASIFSEDTSVIASYDISIDNIKGKEYQPGKKGKTVTLLVENENFKNYDEIEVCHIPDFGKAEKMDVVRVRDDAICLTTDGFSTYVFGGKTVETKDEQTAAYLAKGRTVNKKLKRLINNNADYTTNDTKITKILWTDEDISSDTNAIEIEEQDWVGKSGETKYSHTANINDDGVQNGNYGNNLATKDVVTIPGAVKLHITLKYKTENNYDMIYVFEGEYEGSVSRNMAASTGYTGKYMGNEKTVELDIEGDTATFAFASDSSGAYYGYYAIIEGYKTEEHSDTKPVYARLNGTQIELYTEADKVYFNSDSAYLFSGFQAATEISIPYDVHKSSKIDTSLMTDASYMFYGNKVLETLGKDNKGIEIGTAYWNMSSVTTVAHMFDTCTYLLFDCSYWNTESLEDASYFASDCQSLAMCDISGWDTPKLLDVSYMFNGCNNLLKVVLSSDESDDVKGAHITNYSHFLDGCESLESVDMSDWDILSGTAFDAMLNCKSVVKVVSPKNASEAVGLPNNKWLIDDDDNDEADNEEYYNYLVADTISHIYKHVPYDYAVLITGEEFKKTLLKLAGNSETAISKIEWTDTDISMDSKAERVDSEGAPVYAKHDPSEKAIYLYAGVNKIYLNSNSRGLLSQFSSLEQASFLEENKIDMSKVTDFGNAFYNCKALQSLDTSKWNMSNVTSLRQTFYGCAELKTLDVTDWDVSNITTFYHAFDGCIKLTTLDTSKWDTSSVTSLENTFYGCSKLEILDVSGWDTSKVTNCNKTFYNCIQLKTLDVSGWNTSKVTSFDNMFNSCSSLEVLDVSKWNTSNCKYFATMFGGCSSLKALDVSEWDVSKATRKSLEYMFHACRSLAELDVSKWDVSNAASLNNIFSNCENLEKIDVSKWNVSNITEMNGVFSGCRSLDGIDVSDWNVSKVTTFSSAFQGCKALKTLNASNWNTASATTFEKMFINCDSLETLDASRWDTSNVTNIGSMFLECYSLKSLEGISKWDTSNVVNMANVFYGCRSLPMLDISEWTIRYDTDITKMLWKCNTLKTIKAPKTISEDKFVTLPLGNGYWHLDENKNMLLDGNESESTYTRFIDAVEDNSYIYLKDDNKIPSSAGDIDYTVLLPGTYFDQYRDDLRQGRTLLSIKWTDEDISAAPDAMRLDCEGLPVYGKYKDYTIYLYTKANKIYLNEDSSFMFSTGTKSIWGENFDFFEDERVDVTRVRTFEKAFQKLGGGGKLEIPNLNTINLKNLDGAFEFVNVDQLNLSGWNTPKITSLRGTFYTTSSQFKKIDVTGWDTSNVTTLERTFYSHLEEIKGISDWNTSKVESLKETFFGAYVTELDISEWDVSNVTTLDNTFGFCRKLTDIDLSKWDTSNVTNLDRVFLQCESLKTIDVSKWDTINVTTMKSAFSACKSLTFIDLSNWKLANKSVQVSQIFEYSTKLAKIKTPYIASGETPYNNNIIFPSTNWGLDDNEDGILDGTKTFSSIASDKVSHTYIKGNLNVVEFEIVGDTINIPQQAFLGTDTTAKVSLPKYKKPGFMLDGWYTDKGCTIKYDETQTVKDSFTLYAKWQRPRFNITFDPNGGTLIGTSTKTVIYGMQYDKMPSVEKEGYFFGGWRTPSGEIVNSKNIVLLTSDTTLTAYWSDKEIKFTVTFETNGGTEVAPQEVGYGKTVERPETTRERYIIDKWYTDEDLTSEWDFESDTVDCDMTLYAGWIRSSFGITFDANGGVFSDGTKTKTAEIAVGEKITAPNAPEKPKCTFIGWSEDGTNLYDMSAAPEDDITLYAVWEKNTIKVSFNTNGGFFSDGTRLKTVEMTVGDMIAAPETPAKEKHTFMGWSEDGTNIYDMSAAPEDDITLYAVWEKSVFTVTFDANSGRFTGGEEEVSTEVEKNKSVGTSETPTKEGYTFKGWYYNGDMWSTDMAVTKDMTVTAVWQLIDDNDSDKLIISYKEHEWEEKKKNTDEDPIVDTLPSLQLHPEFKQN